MPTIAKIKIPDSKELRNELDILYEQTQHVDLANWSLSVTRHILEIVGIDYTSIEELVYGFRINELWQNGQSRMFDVRQAGFKIHKLARECTDKIKSNALRTAGQAVSSGHMREHAMVCSDYAVKTVGLLFNGDMEKIIAERKWQINELKKRLLKML